MAQEYREYRSTRTQVPKENKRKHRLFKKLLKQLIFAIIIFSAVYLFKFSASDELNGYIKIKISKKNPQRSNRTSGINFFQFKGCRR